MYALREIREGHFSWIESGLIKGIVRFRVSSRDADWHRATRCSGGVRREIDLEPTNT